MIKLAYLFGTTWIIGTISSLIFANGDIFARMGAIGVIGGVLAAYAKEKFEDENAPDFVGVYTAAKKGDEAKSLALNHHSAINQRTAARIEAAGVVIAILATFQWGFGDLFFKSECETC